jgi:hypothetical protein
MFARDPGNHTKVLAFFVRFRVTSWIRFAVSAGLDDQAYPAWRPSIR